MKYNFDKGYSLVEILVVMILLAAIGSLVFVNVGRSAGKKKTKAFTQQTFNLCKKARRMAMDNGVLTKVYISSSQRCCWVDDRTRAIQFPEQMRIEGQGVTQLDEDLYAVCFYSDGSSSGGELNFSLSDQPIYAFRVDRLTGLVSEIETSS